MPSCLCIHPTIFTKTGTSESNWLSTFAQWSLFVSFTWILFCFHVYLFLANLVSVRAKAQRRRAVGDKSL
jgi:hypothetical protein